MRIWEDAAGRTKRRSLQTTCGFIERVSPLFFGGYIEKEREEGAGRWGFDCGDGMLVEALVFSLVGGSAALFSTYRVFDASTGLGGLIRQKVVETTLLGLVPAVVGFILVTPAIETSTVPGLYVLFLVAAGLFLASFTVRFWLTDYPRLGLASSTVPPYSLIAVISAAAASSGTSQAGLCLVYLSFYYTWVLDLGDDSVASPRGYSLGEAGGDSGGYVFGRLPEGTLSSLAG